MHFNGTDPVVTGARALIWIVPPNFISSMQLQNFFVGHDLIYYIFLQF
jgi:hypothetical protein